MLKEKMRDDKTVSEKIRKTYIDDRDNRTSISSIVSMYRKLESFFFTTANAKRYRRVESLGERWPFSFLFSLVGETCSR